MSFNQVEVDAAEAQMDACPCSFEDGIARISSGEYDPDKAHASVWVCARPAHAAAARTWVRAITGVEPVVTFKDGAEPLFPELI